MTNTVTVNGHTYTDDADPDTGLAGGGHRKRLIPMISDFVQLASSISTVASVYYNYMPNGYARVDKAPTNDNSDHVSSTAWVIGQGSLATPKKSGVGDVGSALRWAREDHVHPPSGFLVKSITGGSISLTADEASYDIIRFDGVLTSDASVTIPDSMRKCIVIYNNTTSGNSYKVSVKGENVASDVIYISRFSNKIVFSGKSGYVFESNNDMPASKSNNGYLQLQNGIILQWGNVTTTTSGASVVFPVTFPNAAFRVVASVVAATSVSATCASPTVTGFSCNTWTTTTGAAVASSVSYFATGY